MKCGFSADEPSVPDSAPASRPAAEQPRFSAPAQGSPQYSQAVNTPPQYSAPAPLAPPVYNQPSAAQPVPAPAPAKKSNAGVVVLCVILAVALIIGAFFAGRKFISSDDETTLAETTTDESVSYETRPGESTASGAPAHVAFTHLNCWKSTDRISKLVNLGGGFILVETHGYIDYSDSSDFYIVDISTDTVTAHRHIEGYVTADNGIQTADNIILNDYNSSRLVILDSTLAEKRIIETEKYGSLAVDKNKNGYYTCENGILEFVSFDDGAKTKVKIEGNMYAGWVEGISRNGHYLELSLYKSLYDYDTCYSVIDTENGNIVFLDDFYSSGYVTDNSCFARAWNSETGNTIIKKSDIANDDTLYTVTVNEDYSYLSFVPGTEYAVNISYSDSFVEGDSMRADEFKDFCELYSFGEKPLLCDLTSVEDGWRYDSFTALSSTVLASVGHSPDNSESTVITLIDTEALEFGEYSTSKELVDSEIITAYTQSSVIPEVSVQLKDVRARADYIEEKYGITVLLSNQCESICDHSGYVCTTTDLAGYYSESDNISAALSTLERALMRFPEGYFKAFKTETGTGGVRIMLVSSIESDFNVIAYAYTFREWYNVVANIDSSSFDWDIVHELWHSTESKLQSLDWSVFDSDSWGSLNPAGFEYDDNSKYSSDDPYGYTLYAENPCFIRVYSMTNAKEDRATLFEYAMCGENGERDRILDSGVLSAKLDYITRAVRAGLSLPADYYFPWELEYENGEGTESYVSDEEVLFECETDTGGYGLKFRSSPDTDSQVLSVIPDGTVLGVYEESDGWYRVTYSGMTGWVSADYCF